jgi:hypothetical protein
MRVRCISTEVSPRQRERLGRRTYLDVQTPDLTPGKEYLVLGLKFIADFARVRTGPYVWVLADSDGEPTWFDLCLFEVTDRRMSRHWVMRTSGLIQEEVRLWPAQWEAFIEHWAHYPPEAFAEFQRLEAFDETRRIESIAEFQRLHALLDAEFDETASG